MSGQNPLFCNLPWFLYNGLMKFLLPFLFFSNIVWAQTPYVAPTRLLHEDGTELFLSGDYFKSSQRIDEKGKKTALTDGESFDRAQFEAGLRYGLAKNFQIGGGLRLRQNQSTHLQNDVEYKATSSGLQSIFTTFQYGFDPVGKMTYTLEGLYRYVPYSYSDRTLEAPFDYEKELVIGDVGAEYSAGFAAAYTTDTKNVFSARAGWRRPGDYLSPEIYWQGEAAFVWKTMALIAGVDGVSSLGNGQENRPVYLTGSSHLYHGLEREWVTPYVGLNFSLGPNWRTELRAAQVVSGKSTDMGTSFGIQLVRRVEANPKRMVDAKFKSYDLEVTVNKVSPKKNYVVIDKGLSEDIAKGMRFDFYEFDYVGGNVLVARGVVIQTKVDSSIVKITQHYNLKKEIKPGLVGRAQLK